MTIEVYKCSLSSLDDFDIVAKEHWESFQNKDPKFNKDMLNRFNVVCAKEEGKTVGYVLYALFKSFYYDEIWCQVDMFYLKEKNRKQGIGKQMFTLVEEDAKRQGAVKLLSSFNMKQPLDGFYTNMGFTQTHVAVAKEL